MTVEWYYHRAKGTEMEELIIRAGGTEEDIRAWKAGEAEFDPEMLEAE
jgi:hypothetical protein